MKDIDRVSPTLRPERTAIMHQRWAELGFLHWPVPVAALRDLIPRALTVDTHEGQAYVGVVPFTVTGARPMLMPPLPWVSDFHEVNVRTYVHLDGADPGVWFFSLDASNPVVVALGAFAWDGALRAMAELGHRASPKPRFGHGAEARIGPYTLLGCFHPSQQNTFTGKLTAADLDAVLSRVGAHLGRPS